jgi:hypothetical protein
MTVLVGHLLWVGWFLAAYPASGSFLYQPSYVLDDTLRCPAEPYVPQPGDIFLATTDSWIMRRGHQLAGAAAPHHSGIVFARQDGSLALLEAGPHNTVNISGLDVFDHLHWYDGHKVWIRKRRVPLTPEQSERLTAFATPKVGMPFATLRIVGQVTPFRSRGPIRTWFVGGPHGERSSYFCSELVVECLVAAGLIDAKCTRPAATYPRDLFFDRSPNWFLNERFKLCAGWYPPARWTDHPGAIDP